MSSDSQMSWRGEAFGEGTANDMHVTTIKTKRSQTLKD